MSAAALCAIASLCLGPVPHAGPNQPATVAAAVAASGGQFDRNGRDFDILLTALQTAGLVDALSDPDADFTVFAPTDLGFVQTARDLGFRGFDEAAAWQFLVGALTSLGGGDPVPVLTNILLYHVAPRRYTPPQIFALGFNDSSIPTLLAGAELRTFGGAVVDAEPDLANPRLGQPFNLRTGNGVIYGLDRVLIPVNLPGGLLDSEPTPGTIAAFIASSRGDFDDRNHDFDILLNALVAANLVDALSSLDLRATLFAPTDAAFIRTARDLGFTGSDEEGAWQFLVTALTSLGGGDPIPVLTSILLYHVSPRALTTPQIFLIDARNGTIPTLLTGATLTPEGGRLIDADPDIANPRLSVPRDVLTRNGVIQAIDRVLIPLDL